MTQSNSPPLPAAILTAAIIVGIAGDLLLRNPNPRLGFTLWIALAAIATSIIATRYSATRNSERRLLLAMVVLAATGTIARDSDSLIPIAVLSTLYMGAVVIWLGTATRLSNFTAVQALRVIPLAILTAGFNAVPVIRSFHSRDADVAENGNRGRAVFLGVLFTLPLLIVASLLSQSDRVYETLLSNIWTALAQGAVQHITVTVLLAWGAAGGMRSAAGGGVDATIARVPDPDSPRTSFAPIAVGAWGLLLLLTTYLAVQMRVLFGGEQYLMATAGLTLAEYARGGFFELITAAGVVIAFLVAADWTIDSNDDGATRKFRRSGAAMVCLLVLLLASAAFRMSLYVAEFGWSVDRMIASAFMVWVFAALAAFSFTALRNRSSRFALSMLGTTIAWVIALFLLNPESMVARSNLARAAQGQPFDVAYHAALSADALPSLRAGAVLLSEADCRQLELALRAHWERRLTSNDARDWRALSIPLARATAWYDDGARLDCKGAATVGSDAHRRLTGD